MLYPRKYLSGMKAKKKTFPKDGKKKTFHEQKTFSISTSKGSSLAYKEIIPERTVD